MKDVEQGKTVMAQTMSSTSGIAVLNIRQVHYYVVFVTASIFIMIL